MRSLLCFVLCLIISPAAPLHAGSVEEGGATVQVTASFKYLTFLPENYEEQEKWPLVLFLHGAGERGDNLEKVKVHGPPKQAAAGREFSLHSGRSPMPGRVLVVSE
ncbi:MAG: hypothetical protein R3C11_21340 [Planctomycetaceae bacterium]